ncbi:membrane protein [Thermococcus litoralis DSM 5473]|uniref:Membrane protein n=1 Tax=Thermococcus litoralis (strain ATCC 51850 / DSM 5473 / JCM 8560 / NS-C) TaxID=523849 RepID=H3ZK54_THELN|nr:hydrogenase subunit MbhD domain-containing protein [Thermococcus litoralis]EHR79607.1 membrane protein [Thermococcus litoralis DSM 5473]
MNFENFFWILQIFIAIGLIGSSIAAIRFKNLIAAVIAMAVFSLALSVEFYVLQAPDVAIAEAGVGAGLTTAMYLLAIRNTTDEEVVE